MAKRCGRRTGRALGLLTAACVAVLGGAAPAGATTFNYDDFALTGGMNLNGHAQRIFTTLRLTSAQQIQTGSAFHELRVDTDEFHTAFSFRLHSCLGCRADGLAFTLHNSPGGAEALGGGGGGMGYAGLAPSVTVEFDTWHNTEFASPSEPNNNHVAVHANGNIQHSLPGAFAIPGFDIYGNVRWAWLDYENGELEVYLSQTSTKPATPLLTTTVDIPALVGPLATAGFSAATGAADEVHDLISWNFTDEGPLGYVSARGTLTGAPAPAQFSSIVNCEAESSTRPMNHQWNPGAGTKRFTKTVVLASQCSDSDPANPGFNEIRGYAGGTINGPGYQGPGWLEFDYQDHGPGASPADLVRHAVADQNGAPLWTGPLQNPQPWSSPGGVWAFPVQ